MKKLGIIFALGAILVASSADAHQASYFMPQVPQPDNMVIDGNDDDWGWIDPAFAINPDNMFEILGSEWPPAKDDWDCILYVAWSSSPDNSLYYFARVTDDSLGLFVENPQEYWKDDSLEIIVDADHSSENFNETEMTSGQQYGIRVLPAAGQKDELDLQRSPGEHPVVDRRAFLRLRVDLGSAGRQAPRTARRLVGYLYLRGQAGVVDIPRQDRS